MREDIIPALGVSRERFANALGVSRNTLQRILRAESSVTADMAVRLGFVVGNGPNLWLNMQKDYDLYHAERSIDMSEIKKLEVA